MEDINLHFTGDIHAVTSAHNLLAAMIENHISKGNQLGIDPTDSVEEGYGHKRSPIRNIVVGLGGRPMEHPESGFDISVASGIMAILCLARDMSNLKERLGNILVAYTYEGEPVYARQIKAVGAMAVLLRTP